MSSEKKWQNIIIADLLEQVQRIDKLIAMLYPNAQKRPFSPKKYAIVDSQLSRANESGVEYKP